MALNNMNDLLVKELRDLYDAEARIAAALTTMSEVAHNPETSEALTQLRVETEKHALRIAEACEQLDVSPKGVTCQATRGLIRECEELIVEKMEPSVGDAAIISAIQRVIHYKIAGYGSAANFAGNLDRDSIAELLKTNLKESKHAEERLTKIATGGLLGSGINDQTPKS